MKKTRRATRESGRGRTIKEVAEAIGVSVATVSRSLSKPDRVSAKTRERVLREVRKLGYEPNALARNLRTLESRTVNVIVPLVSPFFSQVYRGAEAAAIEAQYSIFMGNTERDPERESMYFRQIQTKKVDGFLLMTGSLPSPPGGRKTWRIEELPPLVLAAEYFEKPAAPSVRVDNTSAADDAVSHLIALGHRRIAHISGPPHVMTSRDRRLGYTRALERAGIAFDEHLVVAGDYTTGCAPPLVRRLMSRDQPPSAIFAANDEMAIGAMHALRTLGYDIPSDVSIVGFDDVELAALQFPPLTTVRTPHYQMGYRSMKMLISLLGGEPPDDARIILPSELKIRGSTAKPATP